MPVNKPVGSIQDFFAGGGAMDLNQTRAGYGALGNSASGLQSAFAGINNSDDVRSRFGIQDVSAQFDPLKQALGAEKNRSLARTSQRAGNSATAERSLFAPVEQHYANAYSQLLGQEGTANVEQSNFIAQLLQGVLGSQDQFAFNKIGAQGGALAGQAGAIQGDIDNRFRQDEANWQHDQAKGGFLDFLGGLVGPALGIAGGLLFPPAGIAMAAAGAAGSGRP